MEKDVTYSRHILDAVAKIEKYVRNASFDDFRGNELLHDGIIRELEIIGEASKRLSEDLKASMGDIPWKRIAGLRDKIVHDYFSLDLESIWHTVQEDIPVLKRALERVKNQ
ncbi:MAG: DUF86 domain-containing protein [Parcubacteria group bacterium]|nr:DUF86 domain-containing protein [Parcubacteria group bacterium]